MGFDVLADVRIASKWPKKISPEILVRKSATFGGKLLAVDTYSAVWGNQEGYFGAFLRQTPRRMGLGLKKG